MPGDIPQNVSFAVKSTIALTFLEANGDEAPINVHTTDSMDGTGIAEKARDFTVQIICH
jgi:serine protease Do